MKELKRAHSYGSSSVSGRNVSGLTERYDDIQNDLPRLAWLTPNMPEPLVGMVHPQRDILSDAK